MGDSGPGERWSLIANPVSGKRFRPESCAAHLNRAHRCANPWLERLAPDTIMCLSVGFNPLTVSRFHTVT